MRLFVLLVSPVFLLSLLTGGAFAASHWEVTTTRAHQDTIWVQAEPRYEPTAPCYGSMGECGGNMGVVLNVSPCPLLETCSGSDYQTFIGYSLYPQVPLVLQAGVEYTFSGYAWDSIWMLIPMGPDMMQWQCVQGCTDYVPLEPVVFGSPVETKPQTWGGIKALFR